MTVLLTYMLIAFYQCRPYLGKQNAVLRKKEKLIDPLQMFEYTYPFASEPPIMHFEPPVNVCITSLLLMLSCSLLPTFRNKFRKKKQH